MKSLSKVQATDKKGFAAYRAFQRATTAEWAIDLAKMYAGTMRAVMWTAQEQQS